MRVYACYLDVLDDAMPCHVSGCISNMPGRAVSVSASMSMSAAFCGLVVVDSLLPGGGSDFGKGRVSCSGRLILGVWVSGNVGASCCILMALLLASLCGDGISWGVERGKQGVRRLPLRALSVSCGGAGGCEIIQ